MKRSIYSLLHKIPLNKKIKEVYITKEEVIKMYKNLKEDKIVTGFIFGLRKGVEHNCDFCSNKATRKNVRNIDGITGKTLECEDCFYLSTEEVYN